MKRKHFAFFLICALIFFWIPSLFSQQPEDLKIVQTDTKITVDGNLEEWASRETIPIEWTPEGTKFESSSDLTVTARFAFDSEYFYAAVQALDDRFQFPERSWRYGDGLYLTFVDPAQGNESDRFFSFGFSIQKKEEVKVPVNRDGEYFPRVPIGEIIVKIVPDTAQKILSYEIAVPWKYLPSFRPFIHEKWGINLIYVDGDETERQIVQLFPDSNYDTEESSKRKGRICLFIPHSPQVAEFQSALNANRFYQEEDKKLTLAVNSPSDQQGWEVVYIQTVGGVNIPARKPFAFKKGMNLISLSLEAEGQPSGLCDLSLGIRDDRGTLKYSEDKQYFLIARSELEANAAKVAAAKKGDLYAKDILFRESLPTLEIRLEWIREAMEKSPAFTDLESLHGWFEDMEDLARNIDEGKPALFPPGQIVRLAHRSEIDGTLQPYSILVPDAYDQKTPLPLLVTLHGSGVDERRFIFMMASMYYGPKTRRMSGEMIMLAPKARGLSDWYLGDSGQDVIECLNHVKKLYAINTKAIILDGFSMGGYGAWRLALLNPNMFRGVIIRSGSLTPPITGEGKNILDLLKNAKDLNVLIIHGDKDQAVSVDEARKAVARLKEMNVKYTYIEVKGAGHGDYDRWSEISNWVSEVLGRDKVMAKPPKKGYDAERERKK